MSVSGFADPKPIELPRLTHNGIATILIVDDDPHVVSATRLILERVGEYNVLVAHSGAESLRLAREHRPDLILLDVHTPSIGGIEVLRQLRRGPETRSVPVLMVSVDAQLDKMEAAFEAGANGFVIKPFDAADLYYQVRSTIALHRVHQSHIAYT